MKISDEELTKLSMEIFDYADKNNQYSYYELKAYMIKERPDWKPAFEDRQTRRFISLYLKESRKYWKIKVKPMIESLKILREVQEDNQ